MSDTIAAHRLSEVALLRMLRTGVEKARAIDCPVGVSIVDSGGIMRGWVLMDGATPLAREAALKKARTAAFTGRPTGGLPRDLGSDLALAISDFTNLAGGFPILMGEEVLGGVAASGGSHAQDTEVAQAALAAVALT